MLCALLLFFGFLPPQDYDGNGFADLAIGISYEDGPSGGLDAGAVAVLYGSAVGLKAAGNQLWNQNSPGLGGAAEADDHFGRVMAWGDFDADGYDDLALGVGHEDIGRVVGPGFVHVMYGGPGGLSSARNQLWGQENLGIGEASEEFDNFGWDVMRGDYNGDGFDDLAIGARKESVGTIYKAGAVYVLYGSPTGLAAPGQAWHQDQPGMLGRAGSREQFGDALASGDFNADGYTDLAIGILEEESGAGGVQVLYGTALGLSAAGNELWTQEHRRMPGDSEGGDEWGSAMAAGDFNGDGADDLAIGAPGEGRAPVERCGAVTVLYGSQQAGLQTHQVEIWSQNSPEMRGAAESDDLFGASLLAGDWNMDGIDDLFVAVLQESYGSYDLAGAVQVIFGSTAGLTATGNFLLAQGTHGLGDTPESGDYFGHGLALGDFDGNGFADFAIGVPREDLSSGRDSGLVHVIYSRSHRRAQEWTQDSPGILGDAEPDDFFGRSFAR